MGEDKDLGLCTPICGRPLTKFDQLADSDGNKIENTEFPWHAGIYTLNITDPSLYSHTCGGTLISHKVVISAANCFTTGNSRRTFHVVDYSTLKVALGKYYRPLNAPKDTWTQIFEVKSIEIPQEYKEHFNLFSHDIAFITLKTPVKYTRVVRPICIDVGLKNFEDQQLIKGALGKVAGWGPSRTLKSLKMPFVPQNECKRNISLPLKPYVHKNIICAGDIYSSKTVCDVESGGGLVFEDEKTKAYYLRGIVSINLKGCKGKDLAIFTKLSSFEDLVEKYLNEKCKRVCKVCGRSVTQPVVEFPWHAGIYEYDTYDASYNQICGGTLISPTVVVSMVYCFETSKSKYLKIDLRDLSTLRVALGKYYRTLNATEDIWAQIFEIQKIEISPDYDGVTGRYAYATAFVILKTRVEYTLAVRPVCIDIAANNFESKQLTEGAIGKVAGWGSIFGTRIPSETLKSIKMPFVPKYECRMSSYVTEDMICAGDKLSNASVCMGDNGGGLVFEDAKTKSYYLRGITNVISPECLGHDYFLFTKLSSYIDLMEKYVEDCKEPCRPDHCDPLTSEKLILTCSTPEGKSSKCDQPLSNNSIAIFSCLPPTYMRVKDEPYNRITCINGEWDRPLIDNFCVPAFAECGKPVSNSAQPAVINGKDTKYGDFPWHAAIYHYDSKICDYNQICGGTLISHKLVVSAAHCFATLNHRKFKKKKLSTIKVALGKFYRIFNTSEDTLAQIFDVESIEIPPYYLDHQGLYEYDIAFVTLKTRAVFTRAVIPICIDIGPDSFEDKQLISGAVGKVVGWGFTENKAPSETLKLAEMPFVPRNECLKDIHLTLVPYLRIDKICVGDKFSNVTVCGGDSGGGLVFYDEARKSYFLRGIVSIGYKCKAIERTLFTKLSSYKELLRKHFLLESEK